MAISLIKVGDKITALIANQLIAAVNQTAVSGIIPSSVANGTASSNGKVSFGSASSVSLNGVFSGSYDNYRIVVNISDRSSAQSINVRMRSSGSDMTNASYQWVRQQNSGTTSAIASSTSGTAAPFDLGIANDQTLDGFADVYGPALGNYTAVSSTAVSTAGGAAYQFTSSWLCINGTIFDGFTLFVNQGTITGTVRVYGYNNLT